MARRGIAIIVVGLGVFMQADARAFIESRGLSVSTLAGLGVRDGTAPFSGGKKRALFFPHPDGWKARSLDGKSFTSKAGGTYGFWNLDRVRGQKVVHITEGELDACALEEVGYRACSVPHGAPDKPVEDVERGYGYAIDALDAFAGAEQIVLWTDEDGPGQLLRADLVKIFGAARCCFVELPKKDPNEVLRDLGPDALKSVQWKPWPVDGLYRLSDIPEPPSFELWNPGFPEWESKLRLAPRTFSVLTGHPGHGKTHLFMQVWTQIARAHGVVVAVASFETRARPHHRRNIRQIIHGRPEKDLTDQERSDADAWIEERFLWMEHPSRRTDLRWLLDTAEVACHRHGARVVQIDPWNRLESTRPDGMKETDYIGQCIREMYDFARDMNCHVQVVAHPAKSDGQRKGAPPILDDISGSKHWDNMADQGFVVHRPKVFEDGERKTEAALYVRKARFEELGYPCKLQVNLNLTTGRFE
jgi:twinkle protein